MKKGYKKLVLLCAMLIFVLVLNIMFDFFNSFTYILFLVTSFFITTKLIGYEPDDALLKKDVTMFVVITCVFYFLITYAIGLFAGFLINGYNLAPLSIIRNVFPVIVIIYFEELIRYNIVKKGSRNVSILVMIFITLVLMDINLMARAFDFTNNAALLEFIFVYLIVAIVRNIYLTYQSYQVGALPNMVFRYIMILPLFMLPLLPALGDYMNTVFQIFLVIFLIMLVHKITKQATADKSISNYKFKRFWTAILIFLVFIIVGITSGWFKYYSLTIGTGSMYPNIRIGDIIIVRKLNHNEIQNVQEGEILVFNHANDIIVHRIIEIEEVNNQLYFYTKGDANNAMDAYITEESNIIGVTTMRIPFIGYPTVWLSNLIN